MTDLVTQEMVTSRLIYHKETGRLIWLRRPREDFDCANKWSVWNSRYSGCYAGTIGVRGYRVIRIFGKMRKASRLTWLYHFGYWPKVIDHIDGNTVNDCVENLRDVSQAINSQNRKLGSRNKTGVQGVYIDGDLIRAQIDVGGKRVYLGAFPSVEAAAEARKQAEMKFGFHPNHGRAA